MPPDADARAQPFVIIGAQKSATTALAAMIAAHPDVHAPGGEIGCFDDPYDPDEASALLGAIFSNGRHAQAVGFKRAELLHRPESLDRIAQHIPNAKLIAVLREPISRTVAAYYHYARGGLIPLLPVEAGLRGILDRQPEWDGTLGHQIIEYSQYAPQLERFRRRFPDNLAIFTQDQLRLDLHGALGHCFDLLGVDKGLGLPAVPATKNLGVYSMARLRWLRIGSKLVYHHRPGDDYFTIHPSRARMGVHRATTLIDRAVFRGSRGHVPELSIAFRARLGALFAPDIEAVEDSIGRLLPSWREAAALA